MYGQSNVIALPSTGVGATAIYPAIDSGSTILAAVAILLLVIGAATLARDHARRNGLRP